MSARTYSEKIFDKILQAHDAAETSEALGIQMVEIARSSQQFRAPQSPMSELAKAPILVNARTKAAHPVDRKRPA
jgi:hypothetical protein